MGYIYGESWVSFRFCFFLFFLVRGKVEGRGEGVRGEKLKNEGEREGGENRSCS